MAQCYNCGSADIMPDKGPRWLGRTNIRLFNIGQCHECGRYVNQQSGRLIMSAVYGMLAGQSAAIMLIVVVGCLAGFDGGAAKVWFGVSFVLLFFGSSILVVWIAHRCHRTP